MRNKLTRFDVGRLPVWSGVQDEPGFTTRPFTLEVSHGLIRLAMSESELEEITARYSSDSYDFITSPPGSAEWGTRLADGYVGILQQQVGSLVGKVVLEIGSGTLYIAEKVAGNLNAERFVACDPTLRSKSELSAVEVVPEYFSSRLFDNEQFDLILSINNLEHMPEPLGHLRDIRRLLKASEGILFLVLPDSSRGLKMGDLGICVHEHLFYYTPETLSAALGACGLVIDWLYTQEDTIFATARPGSLSCPPANTSEVSAALLKTFETMSRRNLVQTEQLIASHVRDAPPLGIHGCSIGLNNILALLNIGADQNIFLFDGDSNKSRKYLPTFDRPIISASDDVYQTMRTVIVAALTFYNEISEFIMRTHNIPAHRIFPITPLGQKLRS